MYIDVDVDDRKAQRYLRGMGLRAENMHAPFRELRHALERSWATNFVTQGGVLGHWPPLDFEYRIEKFANYGPVPPLVITGRLMRSLTFLHGRPNEIGPRQATFGTDVPYARFHQYGTRYMPARKIVGLSPLALAGFLENAAQHVAFGEEGSSLVRRLRGAIG